MPIGFLMMLLFYFDHVRQIAPHCRIEDTQNRTERKQYHCSGETVSIEKTWGFPLGLLSPRVHQLHSRHHRTSFAERSGTTGKQRHLHGKAGKLTLILGACPHRLANRLQKRIEIYHDQGWRGDPRAAGCSFSSR